MMLKRFGRIGVVGFSGILLVWLSLIPLRLVMAAQQAPQPEAILVLGGDSNREETAAQLAKYYPDLEVWVSTGEAPDVAHAIFRAAGVTDERVHLDYRASDTVTNFTTLVSDFKREGIQHLYVVTSDFHMPRAKVIATIVLGSNGIIFTPVAVPSQSEEESWIRIARDGGRSLLWLATGRTGASLREVIESRASL
ncbi:hypothetical protein C7B76_06595 [filamentous cyanobacterium CCP2]|nr:hypothetical protein C7B76_06595 [filamentous cyanobacterium CCP2]